MGSASRGSRLSPQCTPTVGTDSATKVKVGFVLNYVQGARCSSVERALAHDLMGRRIDPSWWIIHGVTKYVVCVILSV